MSDSPWTPAHWPGPVAEQAMLSLFEELAGACREEPPAIVLVLGSGLGVVAERVARIASVSFRDIPGLPAASVHGHRGQLTLGTWAGRRILLFEGRLHYYEGHSRDVVTRPMHVAADLGAHTAILTNAAGGIRADLGPGGLMLLRDQLEWNLPHSYRQPPRPSPYSEPLRAVFHEVKPTLSEGIYAAVTGPCYETPAEIRALRAAGADAVGMSTAWEARTAQSRGLRCAAVSLITNRAAGLSAAPLNHEEVLTTAQATAEKLGDLLAVVLTRLD